MEDRSPLVTSYNKQRILQANSAPGMSEKNAENSWEKALLSVIERAELHQTPKSPLKHVYNAEYSEPTINVKEESDLEESSEVIKMEEKNI
ncbi:hypothetical protein CWI38_0002p0050 [Hamiltosporidium tvaerminnensis]|uniref:Uncharacterized protein n=1 Tax=Hamiltosporidium tvaerminnensis TaxID=1176355 RepID=A0A4Q9M5Y5_9MICR|nr:hypothetical protein CWI38_0002p0050 [Hamiltosporidium tvaerminnensis]